MLNHAPTGRKGRLYATMAGLGLIMLASVPGAQAQPAAAPMSPADVEMMAAMEGLKPATEQMKMTGSVDRDFMLMMIVHHDAGIAMSSAEIGYGKRAELKRVAEGDVRDQQKDNRDMRSYLQQPEAAAKAGAQNQQAAGEIMAAMQKMNAAMNGVKLNGDPDHDFIMLMIPHHEAAISMAQTELRYGSDPRVKKVAQGVFDGQSKDVKEMTAWHKQWFGTAYPMN